MVHPEGRPMALGSQTFEAAHEKQIAAFIRGMEGRSMEEELQRVFTHVEEAEDDPTLPAVDASVFGPLAKSVEDLFAAYKKWTNRVYMNDILNDKNRRQWRQAFQQHYGSEGSARLTQLLEMNKYKIAPISGLCVMLDALCLQLEAGSADDRALAERVAAVWDTHMQVRLFRRYEKLRAAKKKKATMKKFGEDFAAALQVIAQEAERRAQKAA